jgi:hypothetical protein
MDSIIFTTFTHPNKTKKAKKGQNPRLASKGKGIVKNVKNDYLKEKVSEENPLQQLSKKEAIIFIAIRLGILFSSSLLISFITVHLLK